MPLKLGPAQPCTLAAKGPNLNTSSGMHLGKSTTIRESNHGLGVCKEHYAKYYVPKSSIWLAGTGVWKINSVACGFSSIKIDYSDYPKSLISRINDVYVMFLNTCIALAIFFWKNKTKHKLHLSRLFCCNHTCYCVNMVSVMSASRIQCQRHIITRFTKVDPRRTSVVRFYGISPNWLRLCALGSKSTAKVMAGRSVHLTTLFPALAWTSD